MFFTIFVLYASLLFTDAAVVQVTVDTKESQGTTDPKFVGVTIDSGVIRHNWETFDPSSAKILTLARGLAPCYLRVGGTDADFLIFKENGHKNSTFHGDKYVNRQKNRQESPDVRIMPGPAIKRQRETDENHTGPRPRSRRDVGYSAGLGKHDLTNFTMSGQFFDELYQFVKQTGWDLVFDLNVLLRQNGKWDSTNALQLINYIVDRGYKIAGWELGNEPDDFRVMFTNYTLPPEQLVKDYMHLREVISHYQQFYNCILLGPSVAQLSVDWRIKYFDSFLQSGGADVVTAASFHQYYVNGRTTTIDQFYAPDVLNVLIKEVKTGVNLTRVSGSRAQVWLGETSSAWGGGAEGLSDRYVAGFMWLDKLGVSAKFGVDVVIRQSFYGGHYALIDKDTFDPNPDYWLTLMYNLLVGHKVLNVTVPNSNGKLRIYAHCTNNERSGYSKGSVVFYVMNLGGQEVNVSFPQFPATSLLHVYHLTPKDGDLTSKSVLLNGVQLRMIDDNTLPDLKQPVKTSHPVVIPSRVLSFIVIPDAGLALCS